MKTGTNSIELTTPDPRHEEASCSGRDQYVYVSTAEECHTIEQ